MFPFCAGICSYAAVATVLCCQQATTQATRARHTHTAPRRRPRARRNLARGRRKKISARLGSCDRAPLRHERGAFSPSRCPGGRPRAASRNRNRGVATVDRAPPRLSARVRQKASAIQARAGCSRAGTTLGTRQQLGGCAWRAAASTRTLPPARVRWVAVCDRQCPRCLERGVGRLR